MSKSFFSIKIFLKNNKKKHHPSKMMLRPYFFLKKKVTKKTFLNRIEAKNAVAFLPGPSVFNATIVNVASRLRVRSSKTSHGL